LAEPAEVTWAGWWADCATDQPEVPIDGRRLPGAPALPPPEDGRPDGGRPDHTLRPLLRMQIRAADRPAVLQDLLGWLSETVQAHCLQMGIPPSELDVWSALVRVVDGRTMQGRITVRLPPDLAGRRGWGWTGSGGATPQPGADPPC
jgi:hypothetical protein